MVIVAETQIWFVDTFELIAEPHESASSDTNPASPIRHWRQPPQGAHPPDPHNGCLMALIKGVNVLTGSPLRTNLICMWINLLNS